LKGSLRNRYAAKTGKNIEVLLDENLVESKECEECVIFKLNDHLLVISKTPLYMRVDTKNNLSDSLYNDTQFLVQIDVMDYSLLVGFDDEKNEIIVGIVGKYSLFIFFFLLLINYRLLSNLYLG
jgi:hypothetical protein